MAFDISGLTCVGIQKENASMIHYLFGVTYSEFDFAAQLDHRLRISITTKPNTCAMKQVQFIPSFNFYDL